MLRCCRLLLQVLKGFAKFCATCNLLKLDLRDLHEALSHAFLHACTDESPLPSILQQVRLIFKDQVHRRVLLSPLVACFDILFEQAFVLRLRLARTTELMFLAKVCPFRHCAVKILLVVVLTNE